MTKGEMIREIIRLDGGYDASIHDIGLMDYAYVALVLSACRQRARGWIKAGQWPLNRAEIRQRAAERGVDDARARAALAARAAAASARASARPPVPAEEA